MCLTLITETVTCSVSDSHPSCFIQYLFKAYLTWCDIECVELLNHQLIPLLIHLLPF